MGWPIKTFQKTNKNYGNLVTLLEHKVTILFFTWFH